MVGGGGGGCCRLLARARLGGGGGGGGGYLLMRSFVDAIINYLSSISAPLKPAPGDICPPPPPPPLSLALRHCIAGLNPPFGKFCIRSWRGCSVCFRAPCNRPRKNSCHGLSRLTKSYQDLSGTTCQDLARINQVLASLIKT